MARGKIRQGYGLSPKPASAKGTLMLRAIYGIIARLRAQIEHAPDSDYKQGGLDTLDLLEHDLYDEVGEEE
jgi:hypothetical protein